MNQNYPPSELIRQIISEYIEPNGHLLAMERIHTEWKNEQVNFTRWSEVYDKYSSISVDDQDVKEFAKISKQVIEQSVEVRETYFQVVEPNILDIETIKNELSEKDRNEKKRLEENEGFQFKVDNNTISGNYIYTDVNIDISASGEINHLTREGSIPFRIFPEDDLLIVESTSVVDIQKIKRAFKEQTKLEIRVFSPLTSYPDKAPNRVNNFIESFQRSDSSDLSLLDVSELRIENPTDLEVDEVEFSGKDLLHSERVEHYLQEGWFPVGGTIEIQYQEWIAEVHFNCSDMMSYMKIENMSSYEGAESLAKEVRKRFLTHLRIHFDESSNIY
ncbi:hypothetical protein HT576_08370 [Haloterrigena sp. SYSU A121-1]|uniref:Uncharacterized protein n=1 Tax=Haloterrigena gelatinilytica TaxID=2741724 RepID=A0A8J8KHD2_9EURY|nr:hypothetical protein [Haloterrigena gelatinilytica]NUB91034.1 hypothetical protein [Haloterrigena gelatinilytica]